ncbi:MAG: helix-turn-helix domain-containing protein [Armatimonadota bacterium]
MFDIHKMGRQITELRRARGLSQMQLAELLDISFQAVSNWERGLSMPDIAKLPELAEILNTSIDGLFGLGIAVPVPEPVVSSLEETDIPYTFTAKPDADRSDDDELTALEVESGLQNDVEPDATGSNEVTLSSLCALAPFMSRQALSDLADTVSDVEPNMLAGLAPFLDRDTLDRLALRMLEQDITSGISMGYLCGLAPFLSKKSLRDMALRAVDVSPALLAGLGPFLDRDTVDQLVIMCGQKQTTHHNSP